MVNKYKGVAEIEILGAIRGFKFGTAAMAQLCQLEKCGLSEVSKRLDNADENLGTQLNFYFTAAYQYSKLNKQEPPTFEEVANWIDSMVYEQKDQLNKTAFASYDDPNVKAPQEEGQP